VKSRVEDPKGCDPARREVPAEYPKHYVPVASDFLGHPVFSLYGCRDRVTCAASIVALKQGLSSSIDDVVIFHEREGETIKGEIAGSGFMKDGVCIKAELNRVTLRRESSGDYRMESRVVSGEVAPDGEHCSTEGARKALASKPCEKLTVTILGYEGAL